MLGLPKKTGVKVQDDVDAAIRATKPDVAILCTSSSIARLVPQVAAIVKRKVPIVSTTEELAYPTKARRRFARQIDERRRRARSPSSAPASTRASSWTPCRSC